MENSIPKLTKDEWLLVVLSYNGYSLSNDLKREAEYFLYWNISECYQYDEQAKEVMSKEDVIKFIDKIKNLSFAEKVAIIYYCKIYWSGLPKEIKKDAIKLVHGDDIELA